jgi:hypothetical protein
MFVSDSTCTREPNICIVVAREVTSAAKQTTGLTAGTTPAACTTLPSWIARTRPSGTATQRCREPCSRTTDVNASSQCCTAASVGHKHLPCSDAHGAFAQAFSRLFPGLDIQWTVIRCYESALPPVSELSSFEALALSGSHHSAAGDEPRWIPQLGAWLADAVARGPRNLRIVGLCFGSQVCWPMSGLHTDKSCCMQRCTCAMDALAMPALTLCILARLFVSKLNPLDDADDDADFGPGSWRHSGQEPIWAVCADG